MIQPPLFVFARLIAATLVSLVSLVRDESPHGTSATSRAPGALTVTSKDGTRIAFERSGQGPVVILVSGALSTAADGAGLAALLEPRFTVIRYDRRGRGGSGDTPPYAIEREVEDVAALIDAAGGSAFLFGSSSGAVLALEAAVRLPTKVPRVVLYEPPFVVDQSRAPVPADIVARTNALVAGGKRSDAVELFMTAGVGLPQDIVTQMQALPMWKSLEGLAHTLPYDMTLMDGTQSGKPLPSERWVGARSRTLVLCGGASDPWLHAGSASLADLLPGAAHRVLEGLDHSSPSTRPQAVAPVLIEFFAAE